MSDFINNPDKIYFPKGYLQRQTDSCKSPLSAVSVLFTKK